ncbi:hypothetical protein LINPERHAP2_LOCUS409 [Linum perenne]
MGDIPSFVGGFHEEFIVSDDSDDEGEDDPTCPTVRLPASEKIRVRRKWSRSLILRTLGKSFPHAFMTRRLQGLWARKGRIQVWDVGAGHFVARFEAEEDYSRAFLDGPWLIGDHYVVSEEWRPNFEPGQSQVNTIRVWVRLPGLPLEYFDDSALRLVGDKLGRTVRVDGTTLFGSRGNYARVCIEVDLLKPLVSKYRLHRRVRRVEYEGLHEICFHCGRYGHNKGTCPELRVTEASGLEETFVTNPVFSSEPCRPELDEEYGPWMQAKKKPFKARKVPVVKPPVKEPAVAGGTRFTVLVDEAPESSNVHVHNSVETTKVSSPPRKASDQGPGDETVAGKETVRFLNFEDEYNMGLGVEGNQSTKSMSTDAISIPLFRHPIFTEKVVNDHSEKNSAQGEPLQEIEVNLSNPTPSFAHLASERKKAKPSSGKDGSGFRSPMQAQLLANPKKARELSVSKVVKLGSGRDGTSS